MSYILITGASKGIGKALAHELAQKKQNLFLVARSENELKALAEELKSRHPIDVIILSLDLSAADSAQHIADYIAERKLSIHTLINNAGYAVWGNFESNSLEEQNRMLWLHIQTVVNLTYLLLPFLKKEKQAYILNIGSTAAYQAVPTLALYAASKSFIVSFSRALHFELRHSNVSVTCVSPGPVNTNFVNRAGMQAIAETAEKFGISPTLLAQKALQAMYAHKTEYVPGFSNKLGVFFATHFPKKLVEKVVATFYKH
ncbi:MAG: short-chain dehydrogenase/reductase [Chitinophagaceae bacterium]|nr:short-chain dehydrogenase/reductase [Chitinophagaceae bacterium]